MNDAGISRPGVVAVLAAATAGLFFAGFATFDFAQHLDRQVHDIHCSFVPGVVESDAAGESGCQVTMMSPYSSVARTVLWGGLPISLPAMGLFAFLLYRSVELLGIPRAHARGPTAVVFTTASLALGASVVMGAIAFVALGAACKLCIGIYASSLVGFVGALMAHRSAGGDVGGQPIPSTMPTWIQGMVQLGVFVTVPAAVYVFLMPNHEKYVGSCGSLDDPRDPYGVMVSLGDAGGIPALEVFDPLCPACRAFEHRLEASGLDRQLSRSAVLFPLDDTCNWMVSAALHPGACTVSEAILCAAEDGGPEVDAVMDWAFEQQDVIREAAAADAGAAARIVKGQFPGIAKCVGSARAQSKLNKSLRWAVKNTIPVLTPQLYLDGHKLCDEDTDLGLDFALSRMIDRHRSGALGNKEGS